MEQTIKDYIQNYPIEIIDMFIKIRGLIYENISLEIKEFMWAKLPTYSINDSFIRIIPFKDHINIEAIAINTYLDKLSIYKVTPKGMLQLFVNDEIPLTVLKLIFEDTLKS